MKYLGILLLAISTSVSAYDVDATLSIPQDNYGSVTFNGDCTLNGAVVATFAYVSSDEIILPALPNPIQSLDIKINVSATINVTVQ